MPNATAKPPNVMVLMVQPSAFMISTAINKDSGMVMNEISAVRQSRKNASRITSTSTPPINSDSSMLASARSMKLAGR